VIVNAILDEIVLAIARGDRVELQGFGAFTPWIRSPYVGRNPKTGTEVAVPKRTAPYFKPAKEMRLRLNPTSEETPSEAAGHQSGRNNEARRIAANIAELPELPRKP